jgi:hypothetical protein
MSEQEEEPPANQAGGSAAESSMGNDLWLSHFSYRVRTGDPVRVNAEITYADGPRRYFSGKVAQGWGTGEGVWVNDVTVAFPSDPKTILGVCDFVLSADSSRALLNLHRAGGKPLGTLAAAGRSAGMRYEGTGEWTIEPEVEP